LSTSLPISSDGDCPSVGQDNTAHKRRWTARTISRSIVLFLLAGVGLFAVSTSAFALDCTAGTGTDFDGDGLTDLAIGDPDATVGSARGSGRVHIAYGDGTKQTISQDNIADNDTAAGDRFGHALAATDWNGDGCTDLLVGSPFEDWSSNTLADAGGVVFIPGSAEGLNTAAAANWLQTTFASAEGNEAGDQFGYSLAAGKMSNGTPYVLAGAPGEMVSGFDSAGLAMYRTPSAGVAIHQDSEGVGGTVEAGDLFGYAVAGTETRLAIGSPGESGGTALRAGFVQVFTQNGATAVPPQLGSADQGSDLISGSAETGDLMGYSLDMVDYRPTSTTTATVLAVSAPGEDGTTDVDGGWVFELDAAGAVTERLAFDQDTSGVAGAFEPGDLFGASLSAVNRTPGAVVTWDDVLLAVGSPGEDVGTVRPYTDRGWVQGFSLIGAPGDHGFDPTAELNDAGADWRSDMQLGTWIYTTVDHLLIADPLAESPAVYAVPWNDLVSDGEDPVRVYRPSDWGVSEATVGSFGSSMI
jgi:hypothetical protein